MTLNKSQKQLIVLGVIMATIVVVLAIYVFKPAPSFEEPFTPPVVDTAISKKVLSAPEYARLSSPIPTPPGYHPVPPRSATSTEAAAAAASSGDVPLVPGATGRPNPFVPY